MDQETRVRFPASPQNKLLGDILTEDELETIERTYDKLLDHEKRRHIDNLAHMLLRTNKEELDLLKDNYPQIVGFMIEHYNKK